MQQGYIKLYRDLMDNPIWTVEPFSKAQAWVDLLMLTNHTDGVIALKNGEMVKIQRGECGYSMLTLAARWCWSRGKVKRFFEYLKSEKMIQQKVLPKTTIIKLLNYEKYQDRTTNDTTNRTTNDTTNRTTNDTTNRTTNDTLTINEKNVKNDNNVINITAESKKRDPFINPTKTFFLNEYKKVFGKTPFLSNSCCNKLVELSADIENIREIIPEALTKLKEINFPDINFTPSASWLLKDDNFIRVMNDEFKQKPKKERQKSFEELESERRKALKERLLNE